jgi:hypothetical protein
LVGEMPRWSNEEIESGGDQKIRGVSRI